MCIYRFIYGIINQNYQIWSFIFQTLFCCWYICSKSTWNTTHTHWLVYVELWAIHVHKSNSLKYLLCWLKFELWNLMICCANRERYLSLAHVFCVFCYYWNRVKNCLSNFQLQFFYNIKYINIYIQSSWQLRIVFCVCVCLCFVWKDQLISTYLLIINRF